MNIIESIVEFFGGGKRLPLYGADDLEFHYNQYKSHLETSVKTFRDALTDRRWTLMMKDRGGRVFPSHLLGEVTWTYLPIIDSWVADEFIPKVRKFTPPDKTASLSPGRVAVCVFEHDGRPLHNGTEHFEAAKVHSAKISEVLRFLLGDTDSPVMWHKSIDGETRPFEISGWYVGGLNIVERNFKRIEDKVAKFVKFANEHVKE